jgi:hypothetical protein
MARNNIKAMLMTVFPCKIEIRKRVVDEEEDETNADSDDGNFEEET